MSQVRQVGRFEIVRELGRGGMAVVYLARQPGLDREVALKELASFHAEDPAFVERFLRESRLAGSLSHPNIVTVYDFFEHEGVPYIAMEYLERGSLRPLAGALSLAQVAGVLEGVLAGLNHAQRRSIVHRDLKPENLLVTDEGSIKIADFGIAKALNQASLGAYRTATGMAIGTPAYMAPEQATAQEVGAWTDLYTTGVIAYELLVGRVPFGDVDTPMAVLWKHVHEPPPAPLAVKPDLDPGLAEWLERMLAKTPSDRPGGPTQAWEELEEIVIGLLGPRWRREARLVEKGTEEPTPDPLTPATFYEEVTPDTPAAGVPAEETFETYEPPPRAVRPPAAPPPPAPPPVEAGPPSGAEPVSPVPPPPPPAAPPPAPTVPPATPPAPDESFLWPAPERRRRVPLAPAAAAAVVLLALAGGAFLVFRGDGERGPTSATTAQETTTTTQTTAGAADQLVRLRAADVFGGEGDQAMRALTAQEGLPVAGGIDGAGAEGDAALWLLGEPPVRIEGDLGGPGSQAINGVARSGNVLVAVGSNRLGSDEDAAVWTSTGADATAVCTLDSVCGDSAVAGGSGRSQKMFAVDATTGGFVAVGHDGAPAGGNFDAAAWVSADGLAWQRVLLPERGFGGDGSQEMRAVVATGRGAVAVGRDGLGAAVWRSSDGLSWTRVRSEGLVSGDGAVMNDVAAGGPGLVAVGFEQAPGTQRQPAAWVFDGDRWTRVRSPAFDGNGEIRGVAISPTGDRIVAVGWRIGAAGQDAAVWTSADGKRWSLVQGDALGGASAQEMNGVAFGEAGLIGVGDSPAPTLADQDAAVWTARP